MTVTLEKEIENIFAITNKSKTEIMARYNTRTTRMATEKWARGQNEHQIPGTTPGTQQCMECTC